MREGSEVRVSGGKHGGKEVGDRDEGDGGGAGAGAAMLMRGGAELESNSLLTTAGTREETEVTVKKRRASRAELIDYPASALHHLCRGDRAVR